MEVRRRELHVLEQALNLTASKCKGARMITRRNFGAAALALAASRPIWSDDARAAVFPAAAGLAKDIAILRQAYETMHPGLYRYNSKAEMDARFDALAKTFPKSRTLQEAFLALTRFTSAIKCGHTYSSFFNQPKATAEMLFAGRDKLPLHFKWRGGKMIVVKDLSPGGKIARGTEVLTIDGVETKTVLETLTPLVRADGSNDAKRRYLLEAKGLESIETFDVYYPLVFPIKKQEFALTLRAPDGTESSTILPAIDLAERRAARTAKQPAVKDGPKDWSLTYRDDVAVLKMDDWVTYNTKWDWRGFLDNGFLELAAKRPKGLVVDLRGNEGGEDCGNEIVARLIGEDLKLEAYERRVRFRKAPENLWPYLNTWDNSFRTLGEGAEDIGGGFYRLTATAGGGQVIKPKSPRFLGKVAVLIDAGNSSATFQFASLMKREKLGVLIGETTGGNQRGINGGAYFFLQLPASQLEAELPLIGSFPMDQRPDAGVDPDIAVAEAAADIAAGRDPVMDAALAKLRA